MSSAERGPPTVCSISVVCDVDRRPSETRLPSLLRPRRRSVAIAAAVAGLLIGGTFATVYAVTSNSAGDFHVVRLHSPAPQFDLPSLRNGKLRIALSGFVGRPLVVNLWASWCVPCRQEMKGFEAAHQRFGDRVTFLGVDTNDDRKDALAFAARVGVSYELAFDSEGTLAARYDAVGLPTTIFVDARGTMLERRLGAMPQVEVQTTIEKLLRP